MSQVDCRMSGDLCGNSSISVGSTGPSPSVLVLPEGTGERCESKGPVKSSGENSSSNVQGIASEGKPNPEGTPGQTQAQSTPIVATGENASVPSDLSTKTRADDASGHSSVVAAHYNMLQETGLEERCKSRIFYLRNFNNWVKSMLINEYMAKIDTGKTLGSSLRVLDMCCGKGGDLLKWRRGNATHLICTDIAATSVEQCQTRYSELLARNQRGYAPVFTAEFIPADCTRVRLRERFKDASMELNLVSCQFAFHYCFESLPQAECMLRNAAECLKPGGYFIGTMPDAYEIVSRLQKAEGNSFGNDLYQVVFDSDVKEPLPLFGAKYNFHLEGVVDCPEFLVHFPTLVRLAEKFGLQLVAKERFQDFYDKQKDEGRSLLGKMQALETYPPFHEAPLLSKLPEDYEHVQQYMLKSTGHRKVGTLTKSEWEAASLYLVFAFQKAKKVWNAEGKPEYELKKKADVGGSSGSKKRHSDRENESEPKKSRGEGESKSSS